MASLNIVLVEPQIPQNTGNIARTCGATGAALHLIEPLGFLLDDKNLKRAGLDYWHLLDITIYKNMTDFFSSTQGEYYFFTTKSRKPHSAIPYKKDAYLFFGREDAGLPESLLYTYKHHCVHLPMRQDARSLNLSNAVAIGAYEVLRQWNYPGLEG